MQKLLPARHPAPLFKASSSRLIEAAAGDQGLMERAGLAVAKLALAVAGEGTIWVVCGPGNNGGDGLVAARRLQLNGRRVRVSLMAGPQPIDAQAALRAAQQAGVAISDDMSSVPPDTSLTIDGLLGLGLNRAPNPAMAATIERLNALPVPILAIDLPSGLLADTGALAGDAAVRASHTLALLTLKPGLFTAQGRAQCGTLWFDDLGVTTQQPADVLLLGADCLAALAPRSAASHKGSFGDVLVLGGAPGLRGAALLAARAALAAGAGRVYACLLDLAQATEVDAMRPELMLWPEARFADTSAWRDKTLVVGCGGGDPVAALLPAVLTEARRLVLDADGLNAVAAEANLRTLLSRRAARGLSTVITPHPLEAGRLLQCSSAEIQGDRLKAAQALADQFGSTVILKGSGSVIASPGFTAAINSSGSAALATAGTGDVLAGWIGGLWAQQPLTTAHALACAATFWHGLAGETQTAGPLRAADLVERMHALHSHA